jgi:hypothetical protein
MLTREQPSLRIVPPLVIAAALLTAAHAHLLWSLDGLPFADTPNHLARAVVLADLWFHAGQRFGQAFAAELGFTPYLLGDLVLAPLVEALGPSAAGRLWMSGIAASLPLSLAVYMRVAGYSAYGIAIACVLALYLATDWFFLVGFGSFRLAIAATLLALAAWQSFLRSGSILAYVGYVAMVMAGYLSHLSALVFCGAAVGTVGGMALASRKVSVLRLMLGALPLFALVGWHVSSAELERGAPLLWRLPLDRKMMRLGSPFLRYDLVTDGALLALFGVACGIMAMGWRRAWTSGRVVTPAVLSLAFLGLYVALPYQKGVITFIDVRALPLAAIFALLTAIATEEERQRERWAVAGLAIMLASANFLVLREHLRSDNEVMVQYKALAGRIPAGAVVLPIITRGRAGRTEPFYSAGAFATIEAGARTPYLFTGGAQPHFRALSPTYAPFEYWYLYGQDPGDVAKIAATYDYVLAMTPFDHGRLPVRTEEIARNDSALLLEVTKPEAIGAAPASAR